MISKLVILVFIVFALNSCAINYAECLQQNKTSHHTRKITTENNFYKNHKVAYRSFQPVAISYRKNVNPKVEQRTDYDINSYDSEYGGVVSNFTSSIYDDNPPIYPNPEIILFKKSKDIIEAKNQEPRIDLPDDSLADADLKEHNIMDSVTYLYGYNNCHSTRDKWMILVFLTSALSIMSPVVTIIWLMWSQYADDFRCRSKLYPMNVNFCCCLAACILIYIQGAMGASSPGQCEKIALVLHYTHICCAMWIVAMTITVAEYCVYDTVLPLKYSYLFSYGVPGVFVMFNYGLSLEQYETKHYCWMSIEKGMVMGFMLPATILILVNTGIAIYGLRGVNKKRTEMLTVTLQELVKQHTDHTIPRHEQDIIVNEIENMDFATSRININGTTQEKEYNHQDECTCSVTSNGLSEDVKLANAHLRRLHDSGILNVLYNIDSFAWKWSSNTQTSALKTYLNMCLILEPFFAINWVMGVVAIENASHWSTPAIYMVLVMVMYIYMGSVMSTTLPIISKKCDECCEEIVVEPRTPEKSRPTDNIPLLDPAVVVQKPGVTTTPADTISTISI